MQVLTPFSLLQRSIFAFVPGFHFCIFNCKIVGPEMMWNWWQGSDSNTQKQENPVPYFSAFQKNHHEHFSIHTCSDCEMEPWWDTRRGSVKLLFVLWFRLILKGVRGSQPDLRIWQFHENTSNQYNFHMLFSLCYFTLHVYFKPNLFLLSMVLVLV